MVTNGPFQLKQWDEDKISLVKNPNYYAAQEIHFTEVQLLRPKTGTSTTVAYINNEVDWVGGNELIDYASLDSASTQDMDEFPFGSTYYYQFNLNKAPFNNLKIRKALAMAVDRESIHYGTPAYGFVPWNIRGAKLDFRAEIQDTHYFSEDVVLAKKLLQEGLQEEGMTKLPSFSIIMNADSNHSTIARSVISSWNKNLGVEATIELQTWSELLDNRYKQNFTMARAGWAADFNDPAAMLDYFTSWSTDNDTGWSNKLYDSYIRKARQTTEPRDRIQAYAKAEKLLIDQMVILPLYYYVADVLHKSNYENVYVDYDSSVVFARGYLK